MQVCTSIQTDNHTSTPPLRFLQAGCPSCRPTASKHYATLLVNNNQRHTGDVEVVVVLSVVSGGPGDVALVRAGVGADIHFRDRQPTEAPADISQTKIQLSRFRLSN